MFKFVALDSKREKHLIAVMIYRNINPSYNDINLSKTGQ